MVALAAFASALEGQSLRRLTVGGRILLLVGASTAFFPSFLVGGLGALGVVAYTLKDIRKRASELSAFSLGSARTLTVEATGTGGTTELPTECDHRGRSEIPRVVQLPTG